MDGAEWVAQQYHGRYGHAARGPFYVWREWAAQHLPPQEAELYLAMERLMGDDAQRSAALKQAQFVSGAGWGVGGKGMQSGTGL